MATNLELSPEEKTALRAIYTGHDTVCDLVDFLGKPTLDIMMMLDKLEILGYVERCGRYYVEWLRFRLTEKGKNALPPMSEEEKLLAETYGLAKEDYIMLKEAKKLGRLKNHAFNISDNTGLPTMMLVTCANNLEKKGYVKMTGLWRRHLIITEKGDEVLRRVG